MRRREPRSANRQLQATERLSSGNDRRASDDADHGKLSAAAPDDGRIVCSRAFRQAFEPAAPDSLLQPPRGPCSDRHGRRPGEGCGRAPGRPSRNAAAFYPENAGLTKPRRFE